MSVLYPRAIVALSMDVGDDHEQVSTIVVPSKASYTVRSHNAAGSAEIVVHGSAVPFDPRIINGMFVQLFMGAAETVDEQINKDEYRRFVGYVDDVAPKWDENGPAVEIKARDLSAILRDFKPIPVDARPKYSDSLEEAIQRIIDATPGHQDSSGNTVLSIRSTPALSGVTLSAAAPSRASGRNIPLPPAATAWQVIEHLCGLVSRLVSIDDGEIVVRDSTIYSNEENAVASFIFGGVGANGERPNVLSVESAKKFVRNRRGVAAISYNPHTRTRLRAVFPADDELAQIARPPRTVGGSRATSTRGSSSSSPPARDVFSAPASIVDEEGLKAYAKRVYLERSRQEIEGKIGAPWRERDATNEMLAIKNAERITLKIHPELESELRNTADEQVAVDLLRRRLRVNEQAARVLLRASRNRPTDIFYLRSATHAFDPEGVSASAIEYINLIDITNA